MVEYWNLSVPGVDGTAERRAYLYLPACYDAERERRFPVLYMFDGHNVFFDSHATYGKSWGMAEYLDRTRTPLIVAAVECNHGPNNERLAEYTPLPFPQPALWEREGFRPRNDGMVCPAALSRRSTAAPRTLPDRQHTFIGGSSMGGLMSLYAVTAYNQVFSRAMALSPSLWVSPEQLAQEIDQARLGPSTVVYMDYGAREFANHAACGPALPTPAPAFCSAMCR